MAAPDSGELPRQGGLAGEQDEVSLQDTVTPCASSETGPPERTRRDPLRSTSRRSARGREAGTPARRLRVPRGKTAFTFHLATLVEAGMPVARSLRLLLGQTRGRALKHVILSLADQVRNGSSLSEAMATYPKMFDEVSRNMVRAGEESGTLGQALHRLADVQADADRLRARVAGAVLYPTAVVLVAVLFVGLLFKFVVPRFAELYEALEVELPGPTALLMFISRFFVRQWYVVPAVFLGSVLFYKAFVHARIGRMAADWAKLHIPLFGTVVRKTSIARFARAFAVLTGSGMPILEAMDISREAAGNQVLARAIRSTRDDVRQGSHIAPALRRERLWPGMVADVIDVGESSGQLGTVLLKLADIYEDDVDAFTDVLASLAEPVMLLATAGITAFVYIALYMPLVHISCCLC